MNKDNAKQMADDYQKRAARLRAIMREITGEPEGFNEAQQEAAHHRRVEN